MHKKVVFRCAKRYKVKVRYISWKKVFYFRKISEYFFETVVNNMHKLLIRDIRKDAASLCSIELLTFVAAQGYILQECDPP